MVAIFPRLHDPYIAHFFLTGPFLFLLLPLLVNQPLSPLVEIDELDVLWVLHALLDVESERNIVVKIIATQ